MLNSYSMNVFKRYINTSLLGKSTYAMLDTIGFHFLRRLSEFSSFRVPSDWLLWLHIYMSCLSLQNLSLRVTMVPPKFHPTLPPLPSCSSHPVEVRRLHPSPTLASSLTVGFPSEVCGLPVEVLSFPVPNFSAK
jgi:hypothetical protein